MFGIVLRKFLVLLISLKSTFKYQVKISAYVADEYVKVLVIKQKSMQGLLLHLGCRSFVPSSKESFVVKFCPQRVSSILFELVVIFFCGVREIVLIFSPLKLGILTKHYQATMEQLTWSWNNLSLSEKEQTGFILLEDHRKGEFLIATKFFTTRFLQMEAVARTFRQLWRTTNGFRIRNQRKWFHFRCKSTTSLLASKQGKWQTICVILWETLENPMEWWTRMEVASFV